ncbi:MAG: polysaccharide deacetylase [Lachnospiraceae bacterium]|nr:polysaccharide deacetylase [Lachnospiraceae bacterium]
MNKNKSKQKKTFNKYSECGTIVSVYKLRAWHIKLIIGIMLVFVLSILICYSDTNDLEEELNGEAKGLLISTLQMEIWKDEVNTFYEQKALEEATAKAEEDAFKETVEEPVTEEVKELKEISEKSIDSIDETASQMKKAYLTFDDGPSPNTDKILDILDEYGVKGNFFVIGRFSENYKEQYKRIIDDGHVMGMHSYSHIYTEIYESEEAFTADLNHVQYVIYDITGYMPKIYRFPGGSSNTVSTVNIEKFTDILDKRGIVYYDWNVNSGDAETSLLSKEQIVRNVFEGINGLENAEERSEVMILFHDLKEKTTTVEALPAIIEGLQAQGYVIAPIDDYTKLIQYPNT